jgi:hypothetical protein
MQFKHLFFDWLWQPPYEYKNKGTFGHFGGILHAFKAGLGTFVVTLFFAQMWQQALFLAIFDMSVHYCIDYSKVNVNKFFGWQPTTTDNFWRLTGFDQYLHQITYLYLAYFAYWHGVIL